MTGRGPGAGKPVQTDTKPHPAGIVSIAVAAAGYISLAFM